MRWYTLIALGGLVMLAAQPAYAEQRSITELPKDVWNLAFVWTEPIKQVAKQTKQSDPISGVWFGVLDGSVKSVERTAEVLAASVKTASSERSEPASPSMAPTNVSPVKARSLFRYSF